MITPPHTMKIEIISFFVLLLLNTAMNAQPKEVVDAYNLNQAIVGKDTEKLKKLLREGADVNYQYNGRNALHTACNEDSPEMAAMIIEAGAQLNAISEDGQGRTPLQFVTGDVMRDQPELVQLLLKNGADPNLSLNPDQRPLFVAIRNNHPESVKVLLENGARTDLKNSMDQTPLIYVNYLLDRGVSDAASKAGWQKIKVLLNN